jgi:hypothetical protein
MKQKNKIKKGWKIVLIIIFFLIVALILMYIFVMRNIILGSASCYNYECYFPPNDNPCVSHEDCGIESHMGFCNLTLSRCQSMPFLTSQEGCLNAGGKPVEVYSCD